jgi:S1-C subfamily serine protease
MLGLIIITSIALINCGCSGNVNQSNLLLDLHHNSLIDYKDIEKSVVVISHSNTKQSNLRGTGFIYNNHGLVITADHVISDIDGNVYENLVCVRPLHPDIKQYELKVIKRFKDGTNGKDLAVLKIIDKEILYDIPSIAIAETVNPGEEIMVIGFPLVIDKVDSWPPIRKGVISSIRYSHQESDLLILDMKSINGFSGSPVISLNSVKLLGIVKGRSQDSRFSIATKIDKEDIEQVYEHASPPLGRNKINITDD